MPTDLRTRIAAVLEGYVDHSHRYDLADAVIRELGLQQESRESGLHESIERFDTRSHRYVTEWTADE